MCGLTTHRAGPIMAAVVRSFGSNSHRAFVFAVLAAIAFSGCSSVDHDAIDQWMQTDNGAAKLEAAVANTELSDELRAHAAANLIFIAEPEMAVAALEDIPEAERAAIMDQLTQRLWEAAKIENRLDRPTTLQVRAKDGLFAVRSVAPKTVRTKIDGHLVEWLAGFFEGRSETGLFGGEVIIRAIGESAGPKLVAAAQAVIAAPAKDGRRQRLGDELLRGLAYSGNTEAVALLLKLTRVEDRDPALPGRAMSALYQAYVEPVGTEPANPAALAKNLDALVEISRRADAPGQVINDAVALIGAAGMPACLEPLVAMVGYLHRDEAYRWMGAQQGIRCGGAEAIVPVIEALPEKASYSRGILNKYIWQEALAAAPAAAVAAAAEKLVASESAVARASGAELLAQAAAKSGDRQTRQTAASVIGGLTGDESVLRGYDGKGDDSTVGEVATKLQSELQEVAKTPETGR